MGDEEKKDILKEKIDDDELETVSGGMGASGKGGCGSGAYYVEKCECSVETESWCWSGADFCNFWTSTYKMTSAAVSYAASHNGWL